mmetsp:Transcript_15983/g.33780  ORF Transcript_15983/g.33780 Transcript_15983/m.33780 type:complete len:555 (+) Transcript_15983:65-1729(+)
MIYNIIRSPPVIAIRVCRASRTTAAVSICNDVHHLSSSAPSGRRSSSSSKNDAHQQRSMINNSDRDADEPWWSLSSLHKKLATIIATSLPDESLSVVHKSLSERLSSDKESSHKSVSIGEAIVSARAREAHLSQSLTRTNTLAIDGSENPHFVEKQKELEKEMEQRALEKAEDRMRLELQAMEEQWKRKEEERSRNESREREREEKERNRELAFEKWKENAARERRSEEQGSNASGLEEENTNNTMQQISQESPKRHHPILGPQIAQLPYKRIHLTSARTLASLPVYEKQRAYRHERALVMAKDKKKTLWMGVPGVISLMEDNDGRLSILDGQHRVGMMSLLEEEQRNIMENKDSGIVNSTNEELAKLDLNNILVEVFFPRKSLSSPSVDADADGSSVLSGGGRKQQVEQEIDRGAAIFTEINKAEPIKLLDLPGVATKRTRDIIDHAASHYRDAFPAMFSASQKCRAPHLNLDNLREALFASEVIKREKMGSGGELVKWIARKNEALRKQYAEGEMDDAKSTMENGKKVGQAALKKARKHDFYLGLESTWLYK